MTTQLIPVKTRKVLAPKDDLYDVLLAVPPLQEGDVVVVTSKIVSIHQGRCVPEDEVDGKEALVEQEADWFIPGASSVYDISLSIVHNALISTAGIDASNANGHIILLPKKPNEAAHEIWQWLREKHGVENLGVIVSDSHCIPLRRGVSGISIGFWGFEPLTDYRGEADLFGRLFSVSMSNHVDSMAAAAVGVMGEGTECTPVVIVRKWPRLKFSEESTHKGFLIPLEEDLFAPLLNVFKTLGKRGRGKTSTSSS